MLENFYDMLHLLVYVAYEVINVISCYDLLFLMLRIDFFTASVDVVPARRIDGHFPSDLLMYITYTVAAANSATGVHAQAEHYKNKKDGNRGKRYERITLVAIRSSSVVLQSRCTCMSFLAIKGCENIGHPSCC